MRAVDEKHLLWPYKEKVCHSTESSVQFTHAHPKYTATMSLSKEYHPNGVSKTCKVLRSEANFRWASGYVAAIGFGMTYCSLAYALQVTTEILKMQLDGHYMRVPNAIGSFHVKSMQKNPYPH